MSTHRLTPGEYWDAGYTHQDPLTPLDIRDYRRLGDRRIVEQPERLGIAGRRGLEVGAGNSGILTYLARTYSSVAEFSGLDYSEGGCKLLSRRADHEGTRVTVYQHDLFEPPPRLTGRFDLVYSLGVVEHFSDLSAVLRAKRNLLSPRGLMFTLIPNMRGALGAFTRRYNRQVYDLHVQHDMPSLEGHARADLVVEGSGYLCSTNFGVLSACFAGPSARGWRVYKWLSRVTKVLWLLEARLGDLPHTAMLSPYLYFVSRIPG